MRKASTDKNAVKCVFILHFALNFIYLTLFFAFPLITLSHSLQGTTLSASLLLTSIP